MLRCPKCGGYGKAVSTRNAKDCVIRHHKCDNCGETFTSTQRVNNLSITTETINGILQSEEFKLLIYPLFEAFGIVDFSMYNNTAMVSDLWLNEYFVLSSQTFRDIVRCCYTRFDIYLKVVDDKYNGVIKLISFPFENESFQVDAILGTISNLNGKSQLTLDMPTINKLVTNNFTTVFNNNDVKDDDTNDDDF